MKKLIGVIFFIQMLIITGWGVYGATSVHDAVFVDETTGIVVKQDTPEHTLLSYYELTANNAFESAHQVLDAKSREVVSPEMLKMLVEQTRMENAAVEKVFPANVDGTMSVLGYVRTADFQGSNTAILAMAVLELEDGRWSLLKTMDHFEKEQVINVLEMALVVEDEIEKDTLEGFDHTQKRQILRQVKAMRQAHQQALDTLNGKVAPFQGGDSSEVGDADSRGNMPNDATHQQPQGH